MSETLKTMVSVCMITYNHEKYLDESIKSVLQQNAGFGFELVIGEDHSTDGSRMICEKYAKAYPEVVKLLPSDKNYGALQNLARTFLACDGKYIALLEGDDYWTDIYKLQKQVDLLENDPSFSFAAHRGLNYQESTKQFIEEPLFKEVISFRDFAVYRCMIHTMSVLLRNSETIQDIFRQPWIMSLSGADLLIYLCLTRDGKNAYCFNDIMGVYRIHGSGSWQGLKPITRIRKAENDLNLYKLNLSLSKKQMETLDWHLKSIVIGKLFEKYKNGSFLIRRGIVFVVNRILFISGPGRCSSIIGNKLNSYVSYPDNI